MKEFTRSGCVATNKTTFIMGAQIVPSSDFLLKALPAEQQTVLFSILIMKTECLVVSILSMNTMEPGMEWTERYNYAFDKQH